MNKLADTLIAFLLGTIVGIFLGILYAPEKGSNTRDKLSYKLDRYRNTLKRFTQDLAKGKVHFDNKAKKEGDQVIQSAKAKAEKLLGDVDALIDKIQPNA